MAEKQLHEARMGRVAMERKLWWRRQILDALVLLCIGLFLGLIGPFGSYEGAPAAVRMLWWTGMVFAGWMIYKPLTILSIRLAAHLDLPRAVAWLAPCAVGGIPMAFLIWQMAIWGGAPPSLSLSIYLQYYGAAFPIGLGVTGIFFLLNRDVPRPSVVMAALPDQPPPGLLERVPHNLRGELLCLEVEDHYVRIHTDKGAHMVLMRLRDAIREAGDNGLQVHRSWWVARAAVKAVRKDGRAVSLELANGLIVPVARTSVPLLESAGWL